MHQIITITGRLTRDPESNTYGEKTVCRFAVAVDDGYGDKKTTDFFNVSVWGKMGEKVQRYQKKGSVVQVIGKMKSSKKDKTTYWELRANNVVFFTFDNNSNQQQNNFEMFTGDINISDDDLPF